MSDIVPWVAAGDLLCPAPSGITGATLAKAATLVAENLCGHLYGQRSLRLRPGTESPTCGCAGVYDGALGWGWGMLGMWSPLLFWYGRGATRVRDVHVDQPVATITQIRVDGAVLDPSAYILYGDSHVVRVDGGTFPCCQDRWRQPETDFGTLELACTVGAAPDEAGQMAVQEIACEMGRAFSKQTCQLSRRIQSLTRQQLSVSFPNPSTSYSEGFIDLPLVDLWLSSLDADQKRRGGRMVDLARQTAYRGPA